MQYLIQEIKIDTVELNISSLKQRCSSRQQFSKIQILHTRISEQIRRYSESHQNRWYSSAKPYISHLWQQWIISVRVLLSLEHKNMHQKGRQRWETDSDEWKTMSLRSSCLLFSLYKNFVWKSRGNFRMGYWRCLEKDTKVNGDSKQG